MKKGLYYDDYTTQDDSTDYSPNQLLKSDKELLADMLAPKSSEELEMMQKEYDEESRKSAMKEDKATALQKLMYLLLPSSRYGEIDKFLRQKGYCQNPVSNDYLKKVEKIRQEKFGHKKHANVQAILEVTMPEGVSSSCKTTVMKNGQLGWII